MIAHPVAERWRIAVTRLREQGERLQALTDAIPPEWSLAGATPDHRWVTRHRQACMDYAVALNCVHALLAQESGEAPGGLATPSAPWSV